LRCLSPLQYIIDQRRACHNCPPGLICQGTNIVEKVLPGSDWTLDDGLYKLIRCPLGYQKVSVENEWDKQRCAPCDRGRQCIDPEGCDECTPCTPGTFKNTISAESCQACPEDTFSTIIGATSRSDCTECPARSDTGGLQGRTAASDCQCEEQTTYSLGTEVVECKLCPSGLICSGTATVGYVQPESVWDLTEAGYRLKSCPRGHYVFPAEVDESNAATQECRPCGLGEECSENACIACTPCPAGFFKDTALPEECRPCPINTWNDQQGRRSSGDCKQCPTGASTTAEAQTSNTCECGARFYRSTDGNRCLACPKGAECPDAKLSCAFRSNQQCPGETEPIVGTWARGEEDDLFRLETCPPGYEKRSDSPLTDMCIKCDEVISCDIGSGLFFFLRSCI
jgi:hypothetical protein